MAFPPSDRIAGNGPPGKPEGAQNLRFFSAGIEEIRPFFLDKLAKNPYVSEE